MRAASHHETASIASPTSPVTPASRQVSRRCHASTATLPAARRTSGSSRLWVVNPAIASPSASTPRPTDGVSCSHSSASTAPTTSGCTRTSAQA